MKLWTRLNNFVARAAAATQREEGQTMVEYGLIIAVVALVVVLALATVGTQLSTKFGDIATHLGV
jgi:pilus assembly protein Flp/PilA